MEEKQLSKTKTLNQEDNKQTYDFTIAGLSFKLKSSLDQKKVSQLVQLVDQEIQGCILSSKSGSIQNAAILAALNIAELYFNMLQEKQAITEQYQELFNYSQTQLDRLIEQSNSWAEHLNEVIES